MTRDWKSTDRLFPGSHVFNDIDGDVLEIEPVIRYGEPGVGIRCQRANSEEGSAAVHVPGHRLAEVIKALTDAYEVAQRTKL